MATKRQTNWIWLIINIYERIYVTTLKTFTTFHFKFNFAWPLKGAVINFLSAFSFFPFSSQRTLGILTAGRSITWLVPTSIPKSLRALKPSASMGIYSIKRMPGWTTDKTRGGPSKRWTRKSSTVLETEQFPFEVLMDARFGEVNKHRRCTSCR